MNIFSPFSPELLSLFRSFPRWPLFVSIPIAADIIGYNHIWEQVASKNNGPELDKIRKIINVLREEGQREKPTLSIKKYMICPPEHELLAHLVPEFCQEAGPLKKVHEVACFDPKEFIAWIAKKDVVELNRELAIRIADNGTYTWIADPAEESPLDREIIENYKKRAYWTLIESARLLDNIAPGQRERQAWGSKCTEIAIKRAYRIGDLNSLQVLEEQGPCFRPFELISWAKKKGIKIPEDFEIKEKIQDGKTVYSWADESENNEDSPSEKTDAKRITVDLDAPDFPPELKIAFQAWNAIYNTPDGFDKKKSDKTNIERWLTENYTDLTGNAKNRIAQVVNRNKKGGAPPID